MSWRLDLEALLVHRAACRRVEDESVGRLVAAVGEERVRTPDRTREDIGRAHTRAVHGRFGRSDATCLQRAFGLTLLLRRHGHPAELVIGIRPNRPESAGVEEGHAWVELDGQPFGEPEGKTNAYLEFLRAPLPVIGTEERS